ncbi:uncharacterized protein LOC102800947 [Saccoglossus kowalevskii]
MASDGDTAFSAEHCDIIDNQHLNSDIINIYCQLLFKSLSVKDQCDIGIASTFLIPALEKGTKNYKAFITQKSSLWNLKFLYVPIHVPSGIGHWILARMDVQKQLVEIYDSLASEYTYVEDSLRQFITAECESSDKVLTRYIYKWKYHYIKGLPSQENDKDCGIFVLKYLKCCILGEDVDFQVDSSLMRTEIKRDLIHWKPLPEEHEKSMDVILSDVSSESQDADNHNEEITMITDSQYTDILCLTDGVISCSGECAGHTDKHKMFINNYEHNYCGRRTVKKFGYGMNFVSSKVYEKIQERLLKEHLIKKHLTKSIFETSTQMVCTSNKTIFMKKQAKKYPMYFATRFIGDVLLKEAIAFLVKRKKNVSLHEADELCAQTDILREEI